MIKIAFEENSLPHLIGDLDYPCGGWAVELLSWLDGLHQFCNPVVLTWPGAEEYLTGQSRNVEFVEVWDPKQGPRGLKYFTSFIPKCVAALRSNNIDVMVQACAGLNTGLYGIASKLARKKFVYRVVNDMDVDDRVKVKLKPYEYCFYKLGLRLADMFVCQNDYQIESLKKSYPKKPALKAHNPYKKLSENRSSQDHGVYIAWLGVFSYQKNLPLFLDIVKKTPGVSYRMAGMLGRNVDKDTLDAFEELKECSNVIYVGYLKRTEVSTFLAGATALLNTSRYEGFSNTFLESLYVGTPIVTSMGVDPDNIVRNNSLGYVVDGVDGYIESITSLIECGKTGALSAQCTQYVSQHHDPIKKAGELVEGLIKGLELDV